MKSGNIPNSFFILLARETNNTLCWINQEPFTKKRNDTGEIGTNWDGRDKAGGEFYSFLLC